MPDGYHAVSGIRGLQIGGRGMSICFDVTIPAACTENKLELRLEVTEEYEGDKYHVVVFEDRGPNEPGEYYETCGFDNGNELLNYIRTLNE
jgi:hypothetical protein